MHKSELTEIVNKMFLSVDERNWDVLDSVFSDEILVDYSSMTGSKAQVTPKNELIDSWKSFLPGFTHTHHQTGNFIINIDEENASVTCYGTAIHFLPNETGKHTWTVVGSYNIGLVRFGAGWKIVSLIFNFKFMDGNLNLPVIARKKIEGEIV